MTTPTPPARDPGALDARAVALAYRRAYAVRQLIAADNDPATDDATWYVLDAAIQQAYARFCEYVGGHTAEWPTWAMWAWHAGHRLTNDGGWFDSAPGVRCTCLSCTTPLD